MFEQWAKVDKKGRVSLRKLDREQNRIEAGSTVFVRVWTVKEKESGKQ